MYVSRIGWIAQCEGRFVYIIILSYISLCIVSTPQWPSDRSSERSHPNAHEYNNNSNNNKYLLIIKTIICSYIILICIIVLEFSRTRLMWRNDNSSYIVIYTYFKRVLFLSGLKQWLTYCFFNINEIKGSKI